LIEKNVIPARYGGAARSMRQRLFQQRTQHYEAAENTATRSANGARQYAPKRQHER